MTLTCHRTGFLRRGFGRRWTPKTDRSDRGWNLCSTLFSSRIPFHELRMYADSGNQYELSPDGSLAECEPRSTSSYFDETAKDLRRLFELAPAIAHIRVLDSKPGFVAGGAGELLDVEVISILKDEGGDPIPRRGFYLFHQYARMMIDGKPLCLGDRAIANGTFFLFLDSVTVGGAELEVFKLDSAALVSADGMVYGSPLGSQDGLGPRGRCGSAGRGAFHS